VRLLRTSTPRYRCRRIRLGIKDLMARFGRMSSKGSSPRAAAGAQRRTGEAGKFAAQRPRGGWLYRRPGKFYRRTGWRRRRRALGLKETCQGRACGNGDKGTGGISQRHLTRLYGWRWRNVGLGLKTTLKGYVFGATGIKASGPMRMSGPVSANKSRACEALRPHRAPRSHATRWSGLTGPSALAVSAPGRSGLGSPAARRHR
jgi:hypothetical protein